MCNTLWTNCSVVPRRNALPSIVTNAPGAISNHRAVITDRLSAGRLLAQHRRELRQVFRAVATAANGLRVNHIALATAENPVDIWIRDWGPAAGSYFRYDPSYARTLHTRRAITCARQNLNRYLGSTPRQIPLTLEGGNLVHNGRVAIATEKVFADNPRFSRGEIERLILSIGFQRVVFIPVEPDDKVGHADGIVKFLSPDLLLVNDYRSRSLASYRRKLYDRLRRAKIGVELVPFPWFCTNEKHDGIWSAVGCYVNFVLTSCGIIFPTFSHRLDERVASLLEELTPLPKRSVESTALARLGGVLNCVTLTF